MTDGAKLACLRYQREYRCNSLTKMTIISIYWLSKVIGMGQKIFERKIGFPGLFNYIDDLILTGMPSKDHHSFLQALLADVGLQICHKNWFPQAPLSHAWAY